jgi:selenium-dependent xanthine dehydrogenase
VLKFILNGRTVEYNGDPAVSLLSWLRHEMNLTAAKDGCSGQAACGACLVEVGGKAALACSTPMHKVAGKEVVTLEGWPQSLLRTLGRAFVSKGAVQCGFCTPGFLTRTKILLEKNPNPTRQEVVKAMRFHLCRCTGYVKIVDAVLEAAAALGEGREVPFEDGTGIGVSSPKYRAFERAIGRKPFIDDLRFDGMVHGALRFSDHPRARVLSIDMSKAGKAPGVIRIFTAEDIPGERNVGPIVQDWPVMIKVGETTRYIGDVLAGVVAETEAQAREAVKLIHVAYDVLEPLTDMTKAETSPVKIHADGNLLFAQTIRRGEPVEKVLAGSAHVARGILETQMVDHGFLEPESSVAIPFQDGVQVYSQSQGIYADHHEIAALLGYPREKVVVTLVDCGGAFGGKEDLTVQGHAALYCHHLSRPVKVRLSRPESIRMHPKRHPMRLDYALGCDERGKLTALKAVILGDTGAYASVGPPVLGRAATHAAGAYYLPSVDIEAKAVYTNNIPSGAMRGFGVNQVTFAMETLVEHLCEMGGFDAWQFRYDNALDTGLMTTTGQVLGEGVGLKRTLLAVKDAYEKAEFKGLSLAIKNCGMGNGMVEVSEVKIEVLPDGKLILHHGWTEMGQGIHTVARQILCKAVGLGDCELIDIKVTTASAAVGGVTTASRGTMLLGRSIIDAALKLKKDLESNSLEELAGRMYEGSFVCDYTQAEGRPGEIVSHIAYGFATHLVILDEKGGLDTIYAAHDSGRVLNPLLFEGQIEGGVVMGLGYALSEKVPLAEGRLTSEKYNSLGIPKPAKVPRIVPIAVEEDDPEGAFGAKGVGEIVCIPTAPAIANAFCRYDGVRRYALPLKPPAKTG